MIDLVHFESQLAQMLSLGHSKKAEKALLHVIREIPNHELRPNETRLRDLANMFLPAHKKRQRHIDQIISQLVNAKSSMSQIEPEFVSSEIKGPSPVDVDILRLLDALKQPTIGNSEEEEFQSLVNEMRPLGFTKSAQVSNYIVRHHLGFKYSHISGYLTMEKEGNQWLFDGGFPPNIYARLCDALGLGNEGTSAKPVRFIPYSDLD